MLGGRVQYKHIVAVVFLFGLFMELLDTTIVNVALPAIANDFHASDGSIEWIVTGYLLSLAVFIPASGWVGDRIGTKRTFLFALTVFTLASALCGLASSLGELVAFRVLQGVGGGMLTPVGTAMLFRAFPAVERAKAATVMMIPAVVAPAAGPIVGGALVDGLSWRWIFFVNVPIGIIGLIVGALGLREHREGTAGPLDVPGFVLSGAGLALVLYALSQAPRKGWDSAPVLACAVAGVALCALLVVVELRVAHPMLALRLLGDRMFRQSNLVMMFAFSGFSAVLFLLPLFLQGLRGVSALESGLITFPQALGAGVSSQVVGRIYHRVGPRRILLVGTGVMAIVSIGLGFLTLDTDLWVVRALMFARGLCMGTVIVSMQAATYTNIEPKDTGRASAIFSTLRQVSTALAVAIVASVWVSRTRSLTSRVEGAVAIAHARLDAFHVAFLTAVGFTALAAVAAWFMRDEDAAASRRGVVAVAPEGEPLVTA